MAYQMQVLAVVIVMTVISAEAYEIKRDVVFSNAESTFRRESRPRDFFLDQPFVDRTIGPQTSAVIPTRGRTDSQRTLRDVSSENRVSYSGFSIFRHQPIKQDSFTVTSFYNKPLAREAMPKSRRIRGEWASLRDDPFEGPSLTPEEIFEGQESTYGSHVPFKEQLFTTGTPFNNLFRGQLSPASFERQTTFLESPSMSGSIKFHQDAKPIDSYEQYKDIMTLFAGRSTRYDNEMPRSSSMVPSPEHLLPLNAEMPPSTPVIMRGHNPAMSSAFAGMGEAHSSNASRMELGTMLMPANNCNAPVDSSPTTVPSISVSTNQSSTVGHILTSLTTKPSSPVMPTSIAPSAGNVVGPSYFHATKYGAVSPSLPTLSELNGNMDTYALSHTPKNSVKINEYDFKLLALEAPKNVETQSSMLNYILPEEHKSELKGIQNSFVDYTLPVKLKHDWPLQQFSQPETSSTYTPLSLNGKTKLILPNTLSVAPNSWPMDIKNDVSTMLLLKSMPNAAMRNNMPLGIDLPVDFTASIPNSLPSSASNSISGSITSGISTGIPGGMTTDIPANIPTLNLGQSLHHVEQLRQTQGTRNPWYPTGLQLQLGGFGGINYTLHTGNSATKALEPGIARPGLTSPKLPQPHAPVFAKVSSQGTTVSSAVV